MVAMTILVRRLICLRPLSGSRTATIGIGRVAGSVAGRSRLGVGRYIGFAVVMAQVRRPVPFRTRKLRPGRGDGTALERVWESSTPPHSTVWTFWSSPLGDSRKVPFFILLGVPAGRNAPETPILFVLLCRPAGRSPSPGGRKAFPVPGRLGLFRAPKGNFCCSTKTSGEQILFSERAFDTVYDTVF